MTSAPLVTVACACLQDTTRRRLEQELAQLGYQLVGVARSASDAIELVKSARPNVLIAEAHPANAESLAIAQQISALNGTAVILLAEETSADWVRKAAAAGVTAFLSMPFTLAQLAASLECAWFCHEERARLIRETHRLQESLELRKLVERAKGILMEQQHFGEEEAHRCLQKLSQDQGLPLQDICRSIIQVRQVLGASKPRAIHSRNH